MTPGVVVCTRGDRLSLVDALRSAANQLPPDGEIVLVRSGTTPDVPLRPEVAAWISRSATTISIVCEPVLGIARARTVGMSQTESDVVVFLDDDVVARPGWFAALRDSMVDPNVGAAGGTIIPQWPRGSAPRWLPNALRVYYGERHAGQCAFLPFGSNMALRKSAAAAVGGFRLDLGPIGRVPLLHEDTELCTRLAAAGYLIVDVPGAVVEHRVEPRQASIPWVLKRAWYLGASDQRRDRGSSSAMPSERHQAVLRAAKDFPLRLDAKNLVHGCTMLVAVISRLLHRWVAWR